MPSMLPDPSGAFIVLTLLGLLPFLAMVVTSFTKIVIVLTLTRNALGVQQVPPSSVINALAIILSVYVMAPIGNTAYAAIQNDVDTGKANAAEMVRKVAAAAKPPFTEFLSKHAHTRERRFFVKSAKALWPKDMAEKLTDTDFLVLIPAFTVTELTSAFQIGFVIYLAFIVVDFVVASVLLSLNMSMISPTVVSVPFKLLLFIALDGWSKLIHNLILSYR